MIALEICAADIESVHAAIKGGADRVELCSGLAEGGMTPSDGLIKTAIATGIPVHVLIRPRGGDFIYSKAEKDIMLDDINRISRLGAAAIVTGALTPDGDIDEDFLKEALAAANGVKFTFHRAFDRCRNPLQAFNTLLQYKVDFLLTSGCAASAMEGAELIAELQRLSDGVTNVIAAAGINSDNIQSLAAKTGCSHFHASARKVNLSDTDDPLFPPHFSSDSTEVSKIKSYLSSICK